MGLQERLADMPIVGTAMAVQKRTKRDAADQFGAALAFFGFISMIPMIAIAVTVAASFLADEPARMQEVVDAIEGAIPGLGASDALAASIDNIVDNSGTIGLVGALVLLWTGLRITNALQTATRFVFGLPLAEAKTVMLRLWQLASLFLLGILALGSVAATSFATSLLSSNLGAQVAGIVPFLIFVLGGLFDILLFWAAYRIYSVGGTLSWRDLLPGSVLGGVGWSALKYFGATYVARQADSFTRGQGDVSATVTVLASTVGLLLLFYIAGRLYVYGAELNAELAGVGQSREATVDQPVARAEDDPEPGPADHDAPVGVGPDADTGDAPPARPGRVAPAGAMATAAATLSDDGSLADAFRERGRLAPERATEGGSEVVPWETPAGSPLRDRRTRQVAAFASSALAVLTAGLLGRRS